jgi:hypothetical protein
MSDLMENEEGRAEGIGAPAGALEKTVEFDIDKMENSVTKVSETPSKHDPDALDAHASAGHELIAIDGKKPMASGWRRIAPVSLADAKARMAKGGNVGVRLRDIDLVVDVDPRHFAAGDDPLARLKADFGLPEAPFVRTGGGGQHIYMRKPGDMAVRGKLDLFEGIEFKSDGFQVVAAGSIHPETGKPYRLDDDPLALSLSEAPEAPMGLLDAIRKPSASSPSSEVALVDPEKLAEWLDIIDVSAFKDETKWRELMMSCHHATGGSGMDVFVAWSISDPDYAGYEEKIRRRWLSLGDKAGAITVRTLIAALPAEKRRDATELLSRVAPEDDFPNDQEAEPAGSSISGTWDEWVFVAEAMQFIRRKDGRKYRTDQWKALYGGLYPDGEILNAVWKSRIPIRKFERLVYLPEAPEFERDGRSGVYNIWRKSGVEAKLGDVKPFLDHMAFLFPNEADCELVLDYLALLTQKPAQKIHFALLVRGSQGTGKSWIGNLMERIIGRPNVVRPSNDEVVSRWTHWMEGAQLAIVEELMTLGRLEVANRLKPVITDPMIRIEEKNCSLYSIPNHLNFICFTNHEDALKIEHGDRRWLVVFSPAVKKEAAYYERLFGYLADGGASFVKHWLLQRQIVLDGHGVAPATSGKETMRRMSMGDAESFLLDLYEGSEAPFDFDLVRVDDLVQAVPAKLSGKSSLRSRLSKFLKEEVGAVAHTRYTKQHANRPPWQLWSLRNHDVWDNIGASGRIDAYVAHYAIDLMR